MGKEINKQIVGLSEKADDEAVSVVDPFTESTHEKLPRHARTRSPSGWFQFSILKKAAESRVNFLNFNLATSFLQNRI